MPAQPQGIDQISQAIGQLQAQSDGHARAMENQASAHQRATDDILVELREINNSLAALKAIPGRLDEVEKDVKVLNVDRITRNAKTLQLGGGAGGLLALIVEVIVHAVQNTAWFK